MPPRNGTGIYWVYIISCFFQLLMNNEISRYTIATGETVLQGFTRLRPANVWGWGTTSFCILQQGWPAWIGGAAACVAALLGIATWQIVVMIALGLVLAVFSASKRVYNTGDPFGHHTVQVAVGGAIDRRTVVRRVPRNRTLHGAILVGIAASPGIAIGRCWSVDRRRVRTPKRRLGPDEVDDELARFLKSGPGEEELQRARTKINAEVIRGLEQVGGFSGKAATLAEGELYDDNPAFFRTLLQWINEASAEEVRDAAARWLADGRYQLDVLPVADFAALW